MSTQAYQPGTMKNETTLTTFVKQNEISRNQLTNLTQITKKVESFQMNMNPHIKGGHAINQANR